MNERQFSTLYSGFWQSTLPNLETIVRSLNLGPEREHPPLRSTIDPARRDIVSETSFRLCCALRGTSARNATNDQLNQAFVSAVAFLVAAAELSAHFAPLETGEVAEVVELATRIQAFAERVALGSDLVFQPPFPGHGVLEKCEGDLAVGDAIVEIKCVDRSFRSTDLRQVLLYTALRYFAEQRTFGSLVLYNPLRGTTVTAALSELVYGAAGKTAPEFFQELSYVLASGEISR